MPVTYCDVFAFLWRSMACFLDCFRARNDDRRRHCSVPLPTSPSSSPKKKMAEKIRLSSLFAADEREACGAKDRESLVRQVGRSELVEGLLEEVKLLKACGTLLQTPTEVRKTVTFSEDTPKLDMKLPQSAFKHSPKTPVASQQAKTLPEISAMGHSGRPPSPVESSPETPEEIREVETLSEVTDKSDGRGPCSALKASPYPTPRKITDDMQTPGTVYATNMKSLTKGNGRIRSQFVYTVLNPIENLCHLEELQDNDTILPVIADHKGENPFQLGDSTPAARRSTETSVKEETEGDASLSAWLKPPPAYDNDDCPDLGTASCRKPNYGRTPGDRPILGLVASHWNELEDTSHFSPKWWDGNGIPNSTTKYKEDQKVRWHATPFEERLEKALSEDSCIPQRKPITGNPIIFEEEGQDTAISQLPSAVKSVVSF